MIASDASHRILVVDDEPDVAVVTGLSLRGMHHAGRPVELVLAATGEEAVATMRAQPDIAVILLDVVMETETAGLDACRAIREELGNRFVRILLRTGQPGTAPERATIDTYDIDGYLPKRPTSRAAACMPRSAPPSRPTRSWSSWTGTARCSSRSTTPRRRCAPPSRWR